MPRYEVHTDYLFRPYIFDYEARNDLLKTGAISLKTAVKRLNEKPDSDTKKVLDELGIILDKKNKIISKLENRIKKLKEALKKKGK